MEFRAFPRHAKIARFQPSLATELRSQHLGNIRMLELLLAMLPVALLAYLTILKLTQI